MRYVRCAAIAFVLLLSTVDGVRANPVTRDSILVPGVPLLQLPEVDGITASISVPASDSLTPAHVSLLAAREAPVDIPEMQAVSLLAQMLPPGANSFVWYELRLDQTIRYDSLGTLTLRVRLPQSDPVSDRRFYALACDASNCRPIQIPLELRGRTLQPPERLAAIHFRFATWAEHTYLMAICEQPRGEKT